MLYPLSYEGGMPGRIATNPRRQRKRRRIRHVERLGADTIVYLAVPGVGDMVVRTGGDANPAIGAQQGVSPVPEREIRYR